MFFRRSKEGRKSCLSWYEKRTIKSILDSLLKTAQFDNEESEYFISWDELSLSFHPDEYQALCSVIKKI